MRKIIHIIIHHSLTKDGKEPNWAAIKRYHTQVKGWSDIGYHYGIEDVAGKIKIRIGRDVGKVGAHTKGMNTHSIGICVVGNFDNLVPVPEKMRKVTNLVRMLQDTYCVDTERVIGHWEAQVIMHGDNTKSCPGFLFNMGELRREL